MTEGYSEEKQSSVIREPSRPASPATLQGGHLEVQCQRRPPDTAISTKRINMIVGAKEKVYEIDEDVLSKIPCFRSAIQAGVFRESVERSWKLPEDDPAIFDRVLEFLSTGDYFPRVVPSMVQCDRERAAKLFQHQHYLTDQPGVGECPSKHRWHPFDTNPYRCNTLEVPLEVIKYSQTKTTTVYEHTDAQFVSWGTTDSTRTLFEHEILLFCMAEKFMMEDLKTLCYSKILLFPKGPRELAVLADHIPAKVYHEEDPEDINNSNICVHQLLSDCIRYHQPHFNRWRSSYRHDKTSPQIHQYSEYMAVLEREMTPHGAFLFHEISKSRDSIEEAPSWLYRYWTCADEQIGILLREYTEADAKRDWLCYAEQSDEDASNKVPVILHSDNLFKGFEFCESRGGDTIARVTLDKPIEGMAYGLNTRCGQWGFFPRRLLRFLETKSYRDCPCDDCEPPTGKTRNGRFLWHDPKDEGLPYRPGIRQKELQKHIKDRSHRPLPGLELSIFP
ncbi:hypothetical protein MMC16_007573 [Acarospora aff. strigata]|nr:hypothetical protein [Acarospora aff. strigata]